MSSDPQNSGPGDTGSLQTGAKRNSPEAHQEVTRGASASSEEDLGSPELHQSYEKLDNNNTDNDERGAVQDPTSSCESLSLSSSQMLSFSERPSSSESLSSSERLSSSQVLAFSQVSKRILNLQPKVLEILDDEIDEVAKEFERNGIEAVFVLNIDDQVAEVVGASPAHAQNANDLVKKLVVRETVEVEDKSLILLKEQNWIQKNYKVRMQINRADGTWKLMGLRENVKKAKAEMMKIADDNKVKKIKFKCPTSTRRFLVEQRQEEIKSIEQKLEQFQVKIKWNRKKDFIITGTKEGPARARGLLAALSNKHNVFKETFQIELPGLDKFLTKGGGDQLVRSVERDQECVVEVKQNFKRETEESAAVAESSDDEDLESDDDDVESDDDVTIYGASAGGVTVVAGPATLVAGSCKISWKTGDITKEQVRCFLMFSFAGLCSCFLVLLCISCHHLPLAPRGVLLR